MVNLWRLLTTSLTAVALLFGHSGVSVAPPPTPADQTAIVLQNIASLVAISLPSSTFASSSALIPTPTLKPGLLPKLNFKPFKVSTATTSGAMATGAKPSTPAVVVSAPVKSAPLATMNAQTFLNATTLSFKEQREGPFEPVLTTNIGGGNTIVWNPTQTTSVGGTGTFAPSFSVSYSCDPPPDSPLPTASDQNPTFEVRTAYDCTVTLTPQTGADRTARSKDFSFTTPAGQLIVAPPASMNTVLANDENDGGIVFNNEDTNPVTITNLVVDVSYTALVGGTPLVLRFADPVTGLSLYDYHLENVPLDPGSTYTHTVTGIQVPLSFTVGAEKAKMLPVEILGVNRMSVLGVNPTVTVTLRNVVTNPFVERLILTAAQLSWSCVVPVGGFDPNATSGAFAAGNACLH